MPSLSILRKCSLRLASVDLGASHSLAAIEQTFHRCLGPYQNRNAPPPPASVSRLSGKRSIGPRVPKEITGQSSVALDQRQQRPSRTPSRWSRIGGIRALRKYVSAVDGHRSRNVAADIRMVRHRQRISEQPLATKAGIRIMTLGGTFRLRKGSFMMMASPRRMS
jgi:hypothetical protein